LFVIQQGGRRTTLAYPQLRDDPNAAGGNLLAITNRLVYSFEFHRHRTNGYIYMFSNGRETNLLNRISRFTVGSRRRVAIESEQVILERRRVDGGGLGSGTTGCYIPAVTDSIR
jgi:hypothetical protein